MSDPLAALRRFAGRLIPASAEYDVPGADDERIFGEILAALGPSSATIGAMARDLPALEALDLPATMQRLGEAHGPAFGALIVALTQSYYRDDRVMRSLGMEARAPFPKGFELGASDWSLLEPVKARPKLWRDAP